MLSRFELVEPANWIGRPGEMPDLNFYSALCTVVIKFDFIGLATLSKPFLSRFQHKLISEMILLSENE